MPILKAIRTLNAIENGTLDSVSLETRLSNIGLLAEFTNLLSKKGQAMRMASNELTMRTMTSSDLARKAIFETESRYNTISAQSVSSSILAMKVVSESIVTLNLIYDNPRSWNIFKVSQHYENNILSIVSLFAGVNASDYDDMEDLISTSAAANVIASTRALSAAVESQATMEIIIDSPSAMNDIAASEEATRILGNSTLSVNLIAQNQNALAAATESARQILVGIPSALKIFVSYPSAWDFILSTSTVLTETIYPVIIALTGIDPTIYEDVESIFNNSVEIDKVARNAGVMAAIMYETNTLDLLIASPHLDVVLANDVSMGIFAADEIVMSALIGNSVAFPILLTNPLAKSTIFTSSNLVSVMLESGSDSLSFLDSIKQTKVGPTPDTKIGPTQSLGVPGNIILLTAKIGSITAATIDNTFVGDTQPAAIFPCPGTHAGSVYPIINLPFTNIQWDINSIAATAAAQVTITYVDFN
jgi:hypothetical protein